MPECDVVDLLVGSLEYCGAVSEVVGVFGNVVPVPVEDLNVLDGQVDASYHVGETRMRLYVCVS